MGVTVSVTEFVDLTLELPELSVESRLQNE